MPVINDHGIHLNIHYGLGCPPAQDESGQQDYLIFCRGSQPKPSFATGILEGGQHQLWFCHV